MPQDYPGRRIRCRYEKGWRAPTLFGIAQIIQDFGGGGVLHVRLPGGGPDMPGGRLVAYCAEIGKFSFLGNFGFGAYLKKIFALCRRAALRYLQCLHLKRTGVSLLCHKRPWIDAHQREEVGQ